MYPNPATNTLKVAVNATKSDMGVILITDMDGKKVYSRQISVVTGNNKFSVDVMDMQKGSYIIKVQLAEGNVVNKFTKN